MLFALQSTQLSRILHKAASMATSAMLILTLQISSMTPSVWAEEPTPAPATTSTDVVVDLASLVLQPVYFATKLAVAVCGVAISAVTLLATGGNEEKAKEILDASLSGPWGVPKLHEQMHHETAGNN